MEFTFRKAYFEKMLVSAAFSHLLIASPVCIAQVQEADSAVPLPSQAAHWDVYLSGYAYHSRGTYTQKQLNKMNEHAWGGGLGKTTRNDNGNDQSYYVLAIEDSHRRPQWMAGYAHQWVFPASTALEVGGGFTVFLTRRDDWFDGKVFPALLPVMSVGTKGIKLTATYIPPVKTSKKFKGNILLLMAKLEFK